MPRATDGTPVTGFGARAVSRPVARPTTDGQSRVEPYLKRFDPKSFVWHPSGQWTPEGRVLFDDAFRKVYPHVEDTLVSDDNRDRLKLLVTPEVAARFGKFGHCPICIPAPSTPDPGGGNTVGPGPATPGSTPLTIPATRSEDGGVLAVAAKALEPGRLAYISDPTGFTDVVRLALSAGGLPEVSCSGTRIATQWVLTAAHCVPSPQEKTQGRTLRVHLPYLDSAMLADCKKGIATGSYGGACVNYKVLGAKRVLRHPDYEPAQDGQAPKDDVALVEIDGDPPVSAAEAKPDWTDAGPENITLAGYGRTLLRNEDKMRLEIGFRFKVKWDGNRFAVVENDMSSACHGDSGGALFRGVPWGKYGEIHRLYAVISYGKPVDSTEQCKGSYMVGFTRLSDPEVKQWICRENAALCD